MHNQGTYLTFYCPYFPYLIMLLMSVLGKIAETANWCEQPWPSHIELQHLLLC